MKRLTFLVVLPVLVSIPCSAQNRSEDEYTRYELLAPDTASFKIVYDVTAVTPGAKYFFNPIRKGSEASDESVIDLMTGTALKFHEVTGAEAKDAGLARADLDTHYIQVELARPVPDGGEGRVRILKTYKDAKSYYREGDLIVFNRPLGIKRNAVVLPKGYALASVNLPVQVIEESDGRITVSFMNPYPGEAPLIVGPAPSAAAPSAAAAGRIADAFSAVGRSAARAAHERDQGQRTGVSGPRDRVLPEGSADARVLAIPRLHGDARRRRQIRQRRPGRKLRLGALSQNPGYG